MEQAEFPCGFRRTCAGSRAELTSSLRRQGTDIARIARSTRWPHDEVLSSTRLSRPQIAGHIPREGPGLYLEKPNSILPNAIVVAFMGGARLKRATKAGDRRRELVVRHLRRAAWMDSLMASNASPALSRTPLARNFEVLVSGFCARTRKNFKNSSFS